MTGPVGNFLGTKQGVVAVLPKDDMHVGTTAPRIIWRFLFIAQATTRRPVAEADALLCLFLFLLSFLCRHLFLFFCPLTVTNKIKYFKQSETIKKFVEKFET